jgi:hypothetical protein
LIPRRITKKKTSSEALNDWRWVSDIHATVTVQLILEFMNLCEIMAEVSLQSGVPDKHIWRFSSSVIYSAKSAYNALFQGVISFGPWERIWKSWTPDKCHLFLWLVAHNYCWTANRLAHRNLPHLDRCPLCDKEEETINHLLVNCVFAHQFWFNLLQPIGMTKMAPEPSEASFDDWWRRVISSAISTLKGGLNSLLILVAWTPWQHGNDCFQWDIPKDVHNSFF